MSDQGIKRKRTGGYPVQERREFRKPLQVSGSRSRGWLAPVLLGSAAALGGAVIYNRWQARDAERQYPPIGRFLDVDGVRLHYIERGQGDPLVLIHGNGTMIQDFTVSGLVDRLADRYRVIVIDRPGYGYSSRPRRLWTPYAHARLFREALAQLGVEQAVVYGHSWGTLVAMALALEFPSLVRGLVLGSGYYYPDPAGRHVPVFATGDPGDRRCHALHSLSARCTRDPAGHDQADVPAGRRAGALRPPVPEAADAAPGAASSRSRGRGADGSVSHGIEATLP